MSLATRITSVVQAIGAEVKALRAGKVSGAGITVWKGTQAQYDALPTKDANTLYFITS